MQEFVQANRNRAFWTRRSTFTAESRSIQYLRFVSVVIRAVQSMRGLNSNYISSNYYQKLMT